MPASGSLNPSPRSELAIEIQPPKKVAEDESKLGLAID